MIMRRSSPSRRSAWSSRSPNSSYNDAPPSTPSRFSKTASRGRFRRVSISSGAIVYEYDAWGESVEVAEGSSQLYRYASKEMDSDSVGNANVRYHFPWRHYLPARATFIQLDPLLVSRWKSLPNPLFSYDYVRANPVVSVDPLGLQATEPPRPTVFVYDPAKKDSKSLPEEIRSGKYKGYTKWTFKGNASAASDLDSTTCRPQMPSITRLQCWCYCFRDILCYPPPFGKVEIFLPIGAGQRLIEHEWGHYEVLKLVSSRARRLVYTYAEADSCEEARQKLAPYLTLAEKHDKCKELFPKHLQSKSDEYDSKTLHGKFWPFSSSLGLGEQAPFVDVSKATIE